MMMQYFSKPTAQKRKSGSKWRTYSSASIAWSSRKEGKTSTQKESIPEVIVYAAAELP